MQHLPRRAHAPSFEVARPRGIARFVRTWLVLVALLTTLPMACSPAEDPSAARERERTRTEVTALTRDRTALKRDLLAAQQRLLALEDENGALRGRIAAIERTTTAKSQAAMSPAVPGVVEGLAPKADSQTGHFASVPLPIVGASDPQPAVPLTQTAKSPDPVGPAAPTVYVTASGSKYHTATCRYAGSGRPVPLAEAVVRNEPCKVCRPPGRGNLNTTTTGHPAKLIGEVPSTPKAIPTVAGGRCAATTQKGARCKRNASKGSAFCWQHGG